MSMRVSIGTSAAFLIGALILSVSANPRAQASATKAKAPTGVIATPDSAAWPKDPEPAISGTIQGPFRNLWLLARVGDENWPIVEVEPKGGQWTAPKRGLYGLPYQKPFELVLVDVSDSVRLNLWEARAVGDRVGNYPRVLTRRLGEDSITVATRQYTQNP